MKMKFKSMLLLLAAPFFLFAGFKNADQGSVKGIQSKDRSGPVWIDFVYTSRAADGTFMGTFTAHGAIETSGTSEMDVSISGDVAHCSQTLVAPKGTITFLFVCRFSTNTGIWYIVSGTGHYKHLMGNGKLVMTFPGAPVLVIEHFTGKVQGNRGHHDDDEDDDD